MLVVVEIRLLEKEAVNLITKKKKTMRRNKIMKQTHWTKEKEKEEASPKRKMMLKKAVKKNQ